MIFDTMKKASAMIAMALFTLTPMAAQTPKLFKADKSQKVTFQGRQVDIINRTKVSTPMTGTMTGSALTPMKKVVKKAGQTITEFELINEDFSKLTAGSADAPDTDHLLCSMYGEPGTYIDNALTNQPGWWGDNAFAAGGQIALFQHNQAVGSCINTPLGDYSGDITVTFRCKPIGDYKSTLMFCNILKDIENPYWADCDNPYTQMVLYPDNGWVKVTMTARNLSADNDGFVQINCYGGMLIDDVQITSQPNFIANPKVLDPTAFKDTEFTANWQPVRLAYNYYLNLYKKVYTADAGLDLNIDFEDGTLPEGWATTAEGGASFAETDGADGTKGLKMMPGEEVTTIDVNAPYNTAGFYFKLVVPEGMSDEEMDNLKANAKLSLRAKQDGVWKDLGNFNANAFLEGRVVDMGEATYGMFSGIYSCMEMTLTDVPEGVYGVLDNFYVTTDRPYTMEAVYAAGKGRKGSYYDRTEETSYTFTDLDPLGEYFYNVRAHYQSLYSDESTIYEAFGVAAPKLLPATDIDQRGGYTANWGEAPKATRYQITNYGVTTIESDGTYKLLDEGFDKIDATVTDAIDPLSGKALGNSAASSLSQYTNMPGWEGYSNVLAQGYMGCEQMGYSTPYIKTPQLYLANGKQLVLTLRAVGYAGSVLTVSDGVKKYAVDFVPDETGKTGYVEGTFIMDVNADMESLIFYDSYGYPFALDYVSVEQELKAGNKVFTMLDTQQTTSDINSYRFSGLDQYDFLKFAYTVQSFLDRDNNIAKSDMTDFMIVDLVNGTSATGVSAVGLANTFNGESNVMARYSTSGTMLKAPVKGLNIVKYADGSVKKVMVK